MSVACDTGAAPANTLTCSHDAGTGTNRITVVGLAIRSFGVPTLIEYGGQPLTLLTNQNHSVAGLSCRIYYLLNPPAGVNQVVMNLAGTRYIIGAISFSGAAQTGSWRASAVDEATGQTSLTQTVTTAVTDVVIDMIAMARSDRGTFVAGANQAQEWADVTTDTAADNVRAASSTQAGADGGVMSWSWTTAADAVMCLGSLTPFVAPVVSGDALQPILQ